MSNPFDVLEARLSNIENLLLDIKHPAKSPEAVPDRITLIEACELTNQSKSQVYKLTMLNEIPFQKYGKRLVFSRKSLLAWMEKRTISAPEAGDVMTDRLAKSAKKHLKK
ncbi:MAG: helix-turn-helix domain-containing protein [Bacteroidales bacterium]|nr:helix-turn-helix domain-containing protein [Bacteroidales bacterium]